jgi:ribonuclease HI
VTEPSSAIEGVVPKSPCIVNCDGGWGAVGAGAVAILTSPSGIKLHYATKLQFSKDTCKCDNNIAEYGAILLGLTKLRAIGVQRCILHIDSKVVAGQIEKRMSSQRAHPREVFIFGQKNG